MPYKDAEVKRKKHAQYSREHYLKNRKALIAKNQERRKKQKEAWHAFKCTLSCTKCGFSHPAALDFHHIDRTNHRNVFKLAKDGAFKAAKEEIKKCIVLCANCHRIHHYEENLLLYKPLTTNQLPEHAGKR